METLVIIPGWVTKYIIDKELSISDYYKDIIDLLEKDFTVRTIEFPGFGQNPEPEKPWRLDDFVSYLLEQLGQLEIRHFYILAHSFGGQVAAKFTYLYPGKVKKLILYNAACIRKPNGKWQMANGKWQSLKSAGRIIFKICPFLRKAYYKLFVGDTSYLKLSEIMQKTMSNVLKEDLQNILPFIKTETLILWGSLDKTTPLNQALKIKALIPHSKIIIHPGGHSFHLQDPKTFAEYIRNFILFYPEK